MDSYTDMMQALTLQPHHIIEVFYPALAQLKPSEQATIRVPRDVHQRYKPEPLVALPAVVHHAGRDNDGETSFFSIATATSPSINPISLTYSSSKFSVQTRLTVDMALATILPGRTLLHVVLVTRSDDRGEVGHIVRIVRYTESYREGNRAFFNDKTYDFEFDAFCNFECGTAWLSNVKDLIWRKSDRAVRHVQRLLERQGTQDPLDEKWMSPRRADLTPLVEIIVRKINIEDLPEDEAAHTCPICWNGYGQVNPHVPDRPACQPVTLACSGNHNVGFQCLKEWCGTRGLALDCPLDRTVLLTNNALAAQTYTDLQMGLCDGQYGHDDRYDDWENFERSCADLDMVLAEDCQEFFTIDNVVLRRAWDILISGAELESHSSTPHHLSPLHFPEFKMAKNEILRALASSHGPGVRVCDFFRDLIRFSYEGLLHGLDTESFKKIHNESDWNEVFDNPSKAKAFPRLPGLDEFFRRMVSRMLMFAKHRACRLHSDEFHQHGLRLYYNPDARLAASAKEIA